MTDDSIVFVPPQMRDALDVLAARAESLKRESAQATDAIVGLLALLVPGENVADFDDVSDARGRIVGLRRRVSVSTSTPRAVVPAQQTGEGVRS